MDHDQVSFRMICEDMATCTETAESCRGQSCAVTDWFNEAGADLFDFPHERQDVLGRVEVAAKWTGYDGDAGLYLVPPTPPVPPPSEWQPGDIVLDRTDFVWRRFEQGWMTFPRSRGVQYGDTWLVQGLGPLLRLDRIPPEVDDRLGCVPPEVARALREAGEVPA
jgi:hypothetical protein